MALWENRPLNGVLILSTAKIISAIQDKRIKTDKHRPDEALIRNVWNNDVYGTGLGI